MQYQEVRALAAETHDVISRSAILQLISRATLHRWLSRKWLFEWAPRAYGFVGKPTWRQQLHAFATSSPNWIVSHRSGLQLWGISPAFVPNFEFIGSSGRRSGNLLVHCSNFLPEDHIAVHEGTSVTSPARSIVDSGAVWGPVRLRAVVVRALDRKVVCIDDLRTVVDLLHSRGRYTKFIEQVVFDVRYDNTGAQSELEREARALIMAAGLPEPSVQHAIPLRHTTLHPDICYPDIRLAIEFDGFEHHGSRFAFDDDRERDAMLAIEGWHVVRFTYRTLHLLVPTIQARMKTFRESA